MEEKAKREMAARIKQRRKELDITQEQMAEAINISYSSYTKIENALQNPSLKSLVEIAEKLQLSLDELVFGEPKRYLPSGLTLHQRSILEKMVRLFTEACLDKPEPQ